MASKRRLTPSLQSPVVADYGIEFKAALMVSLTGSRSPPLTSKPKHVPKSPRCTTAGISPMEGHSGRRQVLPPSTEADSRMLRSNLSNTSIMGLTSAERISPIYAYSPQQRTSWDEGMDQTSPVLHSPNNASRFVAPHSFTQPTSNSMSPYATFNSRPGYTSWAGPRPAPLLRRTSSEDGSLRQLGQTGYALDMSYSLPNLPPRSHPQRRPSNRDEFDGPSQFLEKPADGGYEPREDELPKLPVSLHAQEQDEILSHVNDRLSQCAYDFVAKYQFPVPVEPDKRPVHVPSDREWSEWVYLLKRLATKRRIPARVLYNGQIKQLITILENSLEMRHAAKHQSRPLKDDRNVLQLISSGLQVAKILKDAPAMQFLDNLYVQTERKIQSRRSVSSSPFGTMCIM